jgi:hypothetical protein
MPDGRNVKNFAGGNRPTALLKNAKSVKNEVAEAGRKISNGKYPWEKPGQNHGGPSHGGSLQGSDYKEWIKTNQGPDDSGKPFLRMDIGARNPYAIAELRMARNKDLHEWVQPVSEGSKGKLTFYLDNRSILINALTADNEKSLPYDQLFDPDFNSIVYAKKKVSSHNANVESQASPCSETGDWWDLYKPGGTEAIVYKAPAVKAPSLNDILDDCTQGCTNNCYFIAALFSLVWQYFPKTFPPPVTPTLSTTSGCYTFSFYLANNAGTVPVTVSKDLILAKDTNPPHLVFSRNPASNEIWPALLEKAYAYFRLLNSSGLPYNNSDTTYSDIYKYPRASIPSDTGGNPVQTLSDLTGLTWKLYDPNASDNSAATYFFTKDIPGTCYKKITDNCKSITVNPDPYKPLIKDTLYRTNYPMVAFTYLNADTANPVRHATQSPVSYDTCVLVANHSYSILGTITVSTGTQFVVLRNPYGPLWGAEPTPGEKYYLGSWALPADSAGRPKYPRVLSFMDGIFGLRADYFEDYFQGFGWVA